MFKNYLKTALRNLQRGKANATVNILGLTLGISSSLVLFLMILHLTSFDTFHAKRERIYRLVHQSDGNQGKDYQAGVPSVLPDAFETDFPEAETVLFTSYRSGSVITIPKSSGEGKKYGEEAGVVFTDADFFKIFDRNILIGDAATGLDEPNEAIISRTLAEKFFGKMDAVGEVLKYDTMEFKVTAVMEDAPSNTDVPFTLMLSYSTIKKKTEENGWHSIWSDEQCYFLLKEGEKIGSIESRLPAFYTKHFGAENLHHTEFHAQALADMHFDERFGTYTYNTVSRGMLTSLGVIALVLIITACINFINLSTAEAIKRSKEVGVRKSLGSTRGQLVRQFLGETTMVTVVSMIMGLGLAQLALGILNPFLELQLSLNFLSNVPLWIFIATVTLVVSTLSGLYPALVISGFKPALALKNQISNKNSSGYTLRRALVVLQFCISQLFIIGTIVVINQLDYFTSKDLGFSKDAVIVVTIPEEEVPAFQSKSPSKMKALREEMNRIAGVEMTSLASSPPSSGNVSSTDFTIDGSTTNFRTQMKEVDGNYVNLFKVELVAGKNIEDGDTATGFIVNEKLAKVTGFADPKDIIGKNIRVWGKNLPVVGVAKDFHTVSLRNPIEATILMNRTRGYHTLSLKVNLQNAKGVIDQLKTKWEAAYPEHLFSYEFLDESIRNFYESEQRMSVLISTFTSLAIVIGCLGLFGLAAFMANQRTKEIGVRKVLGASVESIVFMFSKEFLKLVLIGFALAAPLAWWVCNKFLSEFEYKITIGPGIFLAGFGIALSIAMITVSYKSIAAAIRNPVKSLRYE